MKILRGANWGVGVVLSLSGSSSCNGKVECGVMSERNLLAIMANVSDPFAFCRPEVNATRAAGISSAVRVLTVLFVRRCAQVIPAVISTATINMIHLVCWPFASHIQPRQAMCKVVDIVDGQSAIAGAVHYKTSGGSGFKPLPEINSPGENSSIGIVRKNFSKIFCGNISLSHDALQRLIGQRPPVDLRSLGALS